MSRIRKLLSGTLNVGLRPLGGEVVRSGLVGSKAAQINEQSARIIQLQAQLQSQSDRAESAGVAHALEMDGAALAAPEVSANHFANVVEQSGNITARDIFSYEHQPLPCWRPDDLFLYDDWLEDPRNYPVYYELFRMLGQQRPRLRMLEIGVRTGYVGTALARAVAVPVFYVGVDPNEYVANGLDLASQTFRFLRDRIGHFNYALFEGFSWQKSIQASLRHCGPYDLIHIDGDHRLPGKLVDLDLARTLLAPDGLVLVDDFEHHPPVSDAIRRAWALGWYKTFECIPTKRGLAVLGC